MEETKRNKPKFVRSDAHKMIKLGKGVKKNQKWRAAKGRQNKIRLNKKGHTRRPKVGWGAEKNTKNNIQGTNYTRVETIANLETIPKNTNILIGSVGKKKRQEIITKATQMKLHILNKYKEKNNATR